MILGDPDDHVCRFKALCACVRACAEITYEQREAGSGDPYGGVVVVPSRKRPYGFSARRTCIPLNGFARLSGCDSSIVGNGTSKRTPVRPRAKRKNPPTVTSGDETLIGVVQWYVGRSRERTMAASIPGTAAPFPTCTLPDASTNTFNARAWRA